jgi:hypothetical protein
MFYWDKVDDNILFGELLQLGEFFFRKWKKMKQLWVLGIFSPFFQIKITKSVTSRPRPS